MQFVRSFEQHNSAMVGFGIRVMVVAEDRQSNPLQQRLAGLGGRLEVQNELFVGISSVIDDPAGYGLCVIDCEAIGGLAAGRRAHALLSEVALRVPVILVSTECMSQEFPEERGQPVVLRGPVSRVSMRVGFEHALRDRLGLRQI
jgi:hypothetical protein